jgi:hypothetical protein
VDIVRYGISYRCQLSVDHVIFDKTGTICESRRLTLRRDLVIRAMVVEALWIEQGTCPARMGIAITEPFRDVPL